MGSYRTELSEVHMGCDKGGNLDMRVMSEREYRIMVPTGTVGIVVLGESGVAANPLASNFK